MNLNELDIKVSLVNRQGDISFRLTGTNSKGQEFGKELEWDVDNPMSLNMLEQFILETKHEALYPRQFFIEQ